MESYAFDIETIPNSAMISRLPEPEVKTGNLKDEEKIAAKVAEAKAEQIAKMALSPLWGRVCSFVAGNDDFTAEHCIRADADAEEAELLERLFAGMKGYRLVSYNGTNFDIPFIYRRAVVLGIDLRKFPGVPSLAEMNARYNNKRHIDLMSVWCTFGQYEKLDTLASVLADDHKIEIDFREFPELIKTAEGRRKLLDYNAQDVNLTWKLFLRFNGTLF